MALFDALVAIIAFGAVIGGMIFLAKVFSLPTEWQPREKSLGDGIKIALVKKGEEPFEVGIAKKGESFYEDLAWLRAEAKSTCDDLNRGRKLLR